MKLKNVKVGQTVKIKRYVGVNSQTTFTRLRGESRVAVVHSLKRLGCWDVQLELSSGNTTYGYAKDIKLIEDVD